MNILAPSMLAADFKELGREIKTIEENGARYLHYDVMDGIFVPSLSFGPQILESIRPATNLVCDVHLMITEPIRYVESFQKAGADIITVHLEACKDVGATLDKIRELGCKAGLAICPETSVTEILPFLNQVDMILVMSVHPGFGGQKFIPESLERIRAVKGLLEERGLRKDIQVDGGIYTTNAAQVLEAGANIIVAGSAVFRGDTEQNTRDMMEILEGHE